MTGYSLEDEHGIPYYTYHADRTVCDVEGCTCALPTSAQVYAQRTAEGRDEWYVIHGGKTGQGTVPMGPYGKQEAREVLTRAMASGNHRAKLLRVVEDYT